MKIEDFTLGDLKVSKILTSLYYFLNNEINIDDENSFNYFIKVVELFTDNAIKYLSGMIKHRAYDTTMKERLNNFIILKHNLEKARDDIATKTVFE